MSGKDLDNFLEYHGISDKTFGTMTGYTTQAVKTWISGTRKVPPVIVKLVSVWQKHPEIMVMFE